MKHNWLCVKEAAAIACAAATLILPLEAAGQNVEIKTIALGGDIAPETGGELLVPLLG